MNKLEGDLDWAVDLDESKESNGAAYLVHMLLTQQSEADPTAFAKQARRLKPVKLSLRDTGEACSITASPTGLMVANDVDGRFATAVAAESRHVLDVTQVRLAGRFLITGPLGDQMFWGLLRDIATRNVVIKGLLVHYVNTLRFLWLVNVRRAR